MPQDSLRSVVYRSIVPCDDPNGVAEGETIRKSKTGTRKKEHRIKGHRTGKDLIRSSVREAEKEEMFSKGIREEVQTSTPFHLLEVSRGAQKLNQMIDSWSKGLAFDGQSKDIATDLLSGALDLQESLVMLCELQEASKSMAQLKEKSKLKSKGVDEVGVERTDSGRFLGKFYQKGLQNSRLSVDGSSRNSVEELKKVIRESLYRQNLMSIPSTDENPFLDQRKWDSASDIPSTSSSQSSVIHSNNLVSNDGAVSSASQQKKAKGPSVIAKLMGLEELPSEPIQFTLKLSESEKSYSQQRPMFDIEMPKARKPRIADQKVDPKRTTLKEIIETMHFKGLLKSNHAAHRNYSCISDTLHFQQGMNDEMPPIVIMKPLPHPAKKKEATLSGQLSREEGPQYPIKKFRELEVRDDSSKRTLVHRKVALRLEEMLRNVGAEEESRFKMLVQVEEACNVKQINRKLEAQEEPSTKKLIKKETTSNSLEILRKHEVKGSKTTEKTSPNRVRSSFPLNHKPQKKEITIKKADKMPKALQNERKPGKKQNLNFGTISRSPDQVKATSMKSRKPENESIITKIHVQQRESTNCSPTLTRSARTMPRNSVDRTNRRITKAKPQKETPALSSVTDGSKCKEGIKEINRSEIAESHPATTSTSPSERPAEDWMDIPKLDIKDHSEEDQLTAQICQHGNDIESEKESKHHLDLKIISREAANKESCLKSFFLSSPSFLNYAENLFDLNLDQPIVAQSINIDDTDMISTRLFLDCANELMERKSHHTSLVKPPLSWSEMVNPRINISLELLVEEVCNGICSLSSYLKADDDVLPVDSLYRMFESDLKLKGILATNVWDLAWMNGFSVDEANQVVSEVIKQVLGALIEEAIQDFS